MTEPHDPSEGTLVSEYEAFARLPEWVLDAPISDRAVRLFAVLLRHADKGGKAFPSRARIAARLRPRPDDADDSWKPLSTDSVDRAVAELVGIGAMRVQHHGGQPGDARRPNTYYLLRRPATASAPSRTPAATPSRTGAESLAAPVRTEREPVEREPVEREPKTTTPPSPPVGGEEPAKAKRSPRLAPITAGEELAFREFYEGLAGAPAAYPRKAEPAKAREAWIKAVRGLGKHTQPTDPQVILDGARRYRDDPNREQPYTKMPATWLNAGCWNDDPLPPREARPASTRVRTTAGVTRSEHDRMDELFGQSVAG